MMAEARCEWSDLPSEMCQHCRDGRKVLGRPAALRVPEEWEGKREAVRMLDSPPGSRRVIEARYSGGACSGCPDKINTGDRIV